jgi:uncharacterized protein YdbL (DUF1318 family)
MTRALVVACAVALGAAAGPAIAQPTKAQLQDQFKARYPELRDLKKKGVIGETVDGMVAAVEKDADQHVKDLLEEENADRKRLYQVLADEINAEHPDAEVKATPETIAARNALRNIERAGPDEWLRVAKDHWIHVKDFPRFQKIVRYKTQGRVGETSGGLLEIVNEADRGDAALAALVKEENEARQRAYKARAEKESTDAATVARRAGARNFENARIGDMIKDASGWRKK